MDTDVAIPTGARLRGGRATDQWSAAADVLAAIRDVKSFESHATVDLAALVDAAIADLELVGINREIFGALSLPPTINIASSPLSFVENGPALAIDPVITIVDGDSPTLVSAIVSFVSGFSAGSLNDLLEFTPAPGITGNYDPATGVLSFAGEASLIGYQQLLRSVKFRNASDNPSTVPRVIGFTVSDGTSSGHAQRTINVEAVDDPGLMQLPLEFMDTNVIPTRPAGVEFQIAVGLIDPDNSDYTFQLDFEESNIPQNIAQPEIDSATGLFRWTPSASLVGQTIALRILAVAENGVSNQALIRVKIEPQTGT
jgi:hypothetical protein